MASACVNHIGVSSDNFPTSTYSSYGWLSPRVSMSRDESFSSSTPSSNTLGARVQAPVEISDPTDFEFRLEDPDPVAILSADELFSNGKLVPLQLNGFKHSANATAETVRTTTAASARRRLEMEIADTDGYLFSPKAPRCSSRWRELLGFKRFSQQNANANAKSESHKSSSSLPANSRSSLKYFLHRSSKSSTSSSGSSSSDGSSLNLPLLREPDFESLSISSSRLSLSSSSSGHEHEDLPRLSLDSEKQSLNRNPDPNPFAPCRSFNPKPLRMRMVKPMTQRQPSDSNAKRIGRSPMRRPVTEPNTTMNRGVSVDSPRLNSSGKLIFDNLERSSSSPSSFNGGPRLKHRGMERSYSSNVRVTPVLNVPVCSLRHGFGQLFSSSSSSSTQQKTGTGGNRGMQQQSNPKNRIDRT